MHVHVIERIHASPIKTQEHALKPGYAHKDLSSHLKSLNSSVRSLISMPESLIAAIVLGSSSRAVSASFDRDVAALPIAYKTDDETDK